MPDPDETVLIALDKACASVLRQLSLDHRLGGLGKLYTVAVVAIGQSGTVVSCNHADPQDCEEAFRLGIAFLREPEDAAPAGKSPP